MYGLHDEQPGDGCNEFLTLVEAVAGGDAVAKLIAAHGGTTIYVPRTPNAGNVICQTLALEHVQKLSRQFGWGYVSIPLGATSAPASRRAAILRLTAAGHSAREIARLLGIAQRTVIRHRSALRGGASLVEAAR